ncbi:class I SAM-dependent methyltransferase [Marinicella rhabdoformis]|uniref:class I SAM-dependent methyltransferase n=1 Tax=Marinicella rhabdoformis TaxID=2580566 RepID=UPI0012AEDC84|nr:rRNA adenine N-6-methyltransferase family protein [Marinicella rhabdoformis]
MKRIKGSIKEGAVFLKNAMANPKEVAYVFPSSPWLVNKVAKVAKLDKAKRIIELGPGTGGTTRAILKQMSPDAALVSVEINAKFIEHMNKTIDDKRLTISDKGAQNLPEIITDQGWEDVDVIISGIPFSTLPKGLDLAIMDGIHETLKPEGMFLAYQLRDHVSKLAEPLFGPYTFKMVEYKNLPPMRIYTWEKK